MGRKESNQTKDITTDTGVCECRTSSVLYTIQSDITTDAGICQVRTSSVLYIIQSDLTAYTEVCQCRNTAIMYNVSEKDGPDLGPNCFNVY